MIAASLIILLNTVILGYLPVVSSQTILVDSLRYQDYSPRDTIQKDLHVPDAFQKRNKEIAICGWLKIEEKIYNQPINTTFELFTFKPVIETE